jgi:hypothetical protein
LVHLRGNPELGAVEAEPVKPAAKKEEPKKERANKKSEKKADPDAEES